MCHPRPTCRARRMCSRVCGIGPSAADTTRMPPSICATPAFFVPFSQSTPVSSVGSSPVRPYEREQSAMQATHLRCACDHVLHIVCVAWAIYMGVVPLVCLVLDCATRKSHVSKPDPARSSYMTLSAVVLPATPPLSAP